MCTVGEPITNVPLLRDGASPLNDDFYPILSLDVGIRNLAFCCVVPPPSSTSCLTKDDLVRLTRVAELGCIDVTDYLDVGVSTKNANKIPIMSLTRAIVRALEACMNGVLRQYVNAFRNIVIETQPCYKNPHMKSIQIVIFTYFVGFFESRGRRDVRVHMFQPRDKLSIYPGPPIECSLKSEYGRRKKLSILYAQWMLTRMRPQDTGAAQVLSNTKKKDDLADAYLQALVFVNRNHPSASKRLLIYSDC